MINIIIILTSVIIIKLFFYSVFYTNSSNRMQITNKLI